MFQVNDYIIQPDRYENGVWCRTSKDEVDMGKGTWILLRRWRSLRKYSPRHFDIYTWEMRHQSTGKYRYEAEPILKSCVARGALQHVPRSNPSWAALDKPLKSQG